MTVNRDAHRSTIVIDAILARRSIRGGFDGRQVSREHLDSVLECGLAAPSSKNARPWRFHVVTDASTRNALADATVQAEGIADYVPHDPRTGRPSPNWSSTVLESAEVVRAAPALIVIENRGVFSGGRATLLGAHPDALASSLTGYSFEVIGLGAALENMWLAANSLGIGVVFLGDLNIAEAEIGRLLGLPGDLMGVIALGYASLEPSPRREPPKNTQTDSPVVWH